MTEPFPVPVSTFPPAGAEDDIGRLPIPVALQLRYLRIIAYSLILFLGMAQAWSTRHVIFSDGTSYVEIATAYLHGDWSKAINAYWSPLYSWLLALMFWLLRPSPYWQAATLHLLNFLAYAGGLLSVELLVCEIARYLRSGLLAGTGTLSIVTLYIAAYTMFPLVAFGIIHYPSPDEVAAALMLLLMALILRVSRTAGSGMLFLSIGIICAILYLARAAFAASIPICIAEVLVLLRRQGRPIVRPALLMVLAVLAVAGPFVAGISRKEGRFTIGEAGKLTYAWEVDGASRFIYWQGEPGNIGTPVHPVTRVSSSPAAYVFNGPVAVSFSPWFDPSYWYEGITPKLNLGAELRALAVDLSSVVRLLASSPITLPVVILAFHMGLLLWFRRFLLFWPILLPAIAGLLIYCLVYVEKRYIVSNLLIIWLAALAAIRISDERWRYCANVGTRLLCLVFFCFFLTSRAMPPAVNAISDAIHGREREKNMNYLFAERLKQLGLQPGDKVAFIGEGMNHADWARLDNLKIVGEVPITFDRPQKLFNNYLIENPSQIRAFWKADPAAQQRVLQAFRDVGAVMVVTDGVFQSTLPHGWHKLLPQAEIGEPETLDDPGYLLRLRTSYLWLVPR